MLFAHHRQISHNNLATVKCMTAMVINNWLQKTTKKNILHLRV